MFVEQLEGNRSLLGTSVRNTNFSAWLSSQLGTRQWNQTDFAKRVGTSTGSVAMWMNGHRIPSTESCERIAVVLSADLDDVMRAAGHLPPDPYHPNPDSPPERFHAMMKRIQWDPQREAMIDAILRQMVEFDRLDGE